MLDEPTNGLDPGEIREIRELIARLSAHGATVLLSSHHLTEVEQVCSHVIVMNHGRLVADGTVSDLIGSAGSVYVEVDDRERARALLASLAGVGAVQTQGDGLVIELRDGRRSDVAAALVGAGAAARDDHGDATARGRVPRPPRRGRRGARRDAARRRVPS